jgi:hypothetical protein
MWTAGVLLHWVAGVYSWNWRILLPLSAFLQLAAFLIFSRAVAGHKPPERSTEGLDSWVKVVIGGTLGFLLALLLNLGASIYVGLSADSPAFPHVYDQRFVTVATWGFLVPFVWGFSARWLPVFLGLRSVHPRLLLAASAINGIGIMVCLLGGIRAGSPFLAAGAVCAILALRLYEPAVRPPKVRGVHASFPFFIRVAYAWLLAAAYLGLWAASLGFAPGIWGASRHALTVGFLSAMVFSIGSRVLPAFSGLRLLFSTWLMFASLALLTGGCFLRVTAEVIAYQGYGAHAWSWLPVSATTELVAVMIFGINMGCTFVRKPAVPVADLAGSGLPQR